MIYGKIIKKIKHNDEEYIFRYPKIEDIDGVLKFINSMVEEKTYLAIQKRMSRNEEFEWLLNVIKKIDNKTMVQVVIEKNKRIVGNGGIIVNTAPSHSHIGEFGIALMKKVRGQGFGEKLSRIIIAEAKQNLKIKTLTLDAYAKNKPAIKLYKKLGFKVYGKLKNYHKHYDKLIDSVFMFKNI